MPSWFRKDAGHAFSLTVAGYNYIDHVPLDLAPIRWEESGPAAIGRLTFVIESDGSLPTPEDGGEVKLRHNAEDRTLFGGILLDRRVTRGPGSVTWTECEVASYDWFLDNRIVPRWESKRNVGNRVRKFSGDRNMVKDLIDRRGGPIQASNATVDSTNTSMDVVKLAGETLRTALEKIADEAQSLSDQAGRFFYVDFDRQLHYFKGTEGLAAPFRFADGSYVRDVITTSGLVEYWSLREEGGSTAYGSEGVTDLTLSGSPPQGVTDVGVVNEPHYRAMTWDGANTDGAAGSVAGLKVGDTFSFECWVKRTESSGADFLLLTFAATENGPQITLEADGDVKLIRRGTGGGTDFITTTQPVTDDTWHHLVVAHEPSDTKVYVDGVSQAGTLTSEVFGDTWDTFEVFRSANGFVGDGQHVAWYSTKMTAATALAHYQQGISLQPEGLLIGYDSLEERHGVYVRGANRKGSGWVSHNGAKWDLGWATAYLDVPWAKTNAHRDRRGKAFLRRHRKVTGGEFSLMDRHGWRAGQLLSITDDALGLDGATFQLQSLRAELDAGGVVTYDIEYGALSRTLMRAIRRRELNDIILPT